ncbi:hypothetical protein ceV_066 [Chrysochromulina ericina virus CeV-01B]|uniref:Uncharacterized protein n=1 Tax=Chrysochromulina ericina virus CeV-01B TaxID=3070830 RepID=A0A0N9R2X6_9VIRU|nr:hypothetical protein ceV_066 [Chrysochromulina ericina virus]ALH22972.1 hypothetical protein ceV_066 [Chrysochromulina ericina virus CeV-01B]
MEYNHLKKILLNNLLLFIYYFRQFLLYINKLYYEVWMYFNTNNDILFIKNNRVIQKNNFNNIDNIPKADYFVVNYNNNDKNLVKVSDDYSILDYLKIIPDICKFRFMLVMIKSDNKNIDITKYLYNENRSYYIKNSILFDKNFNNWFCMNYLNEELDNIKISLIDHNANEIELNSSQFIKLGTHNYHIDQLT